MRLLLISVAVTALLSASALAQPDHDHGGGGAPHGGGGAPHAGPGGAPHGGPGGAPHGGPGGAPHGGPGGGHGPQGGPPPQARPAPAAPAFSRGPNGGGFARPSAPSNAPAFTRGPNGRGSNRPGPGTPNRGAGPGGARHNFSGFANFHQNVTASRRFHASAYQRPSGWYSHHWTYGESLPSLFWARNYWLTDYVDYALPPPPYGAVWVRVADDALLIDEDSGEIITVEYGVFY